MRRFISQLLHTTYTLKLIVQGSSVEANIVAEAVVLLVSTFPRISFDVSMTATGLSRVPLLKSVWMFRSFRKAFARRYVRKYRISTCFSENLIRNRFLIMSLKVSCYLRCFPVTDLSSSMISRDLSFQVTLNSGLIKVIGNEEWNSVWIIVSCR